MQRSLALAQPGLMPHQLRAMPSPRRATPQLAITCHAAPPPLAQLAKAGGWAQKHRILLGESHEVEGEYGDLLARSKFCLVLPGGQRVPALGTCPPPGWPRLSATHTPLAPPGCAPEHLSGMHRAPALPRPHRPLRPPAGDGWSPRAEDAVLHGCVPVVIMDRVHSIFESILDWPSFSLRLKEDQLAQLPELLLAVPPARLEAMQAALARVWHRFTYFSHPAIRQQLARSANMTLGGGNSRLKRALHNDAFHTILQWLAGRMRRPAVVPARAAS